MRAGLQRALVVSAAIAVLAPAGMSGAHASQVTAAKTATAPAVAKAKTASLARGVPQRTVVRTNSYAGKAAVPKTARPAVTTAAADTGTQVCGDVGSTGTTTTWTAAGAPYQVCSGGATVDGDLVLDGSQGGFEVEAMGNGGLALPYQTTKATISTANTDAANEVTFDHAGSGSWSGLYVTGGVGGITVDLSYVTFDSTTTAITTFDSVGGDPEVDLAHVTVDATTGNGLRFDDSGATVTDSSVSSSGADGIVAICDASATDASQQAVAITGTTVTGAADDGIDLQDCFDPEVTGDTVLNSGTPAPAHPAMSVTSPSYTLTSTVSLGAADGISGDLGAGNGIDAIAVDGLQQGGFTWVTPTDSATTHSLGYLNLGLSVQGGGVVTIPAGAVVKSEALAYGGGDPNTDLRNGQFRIDGPSLDVLPGAVLTSMTDDSIGLPTCGTALASSCTPGPFDWDGLMPMAGAVLTSDTIENANVCLGSLGDSINTATVPGALITATSLSVFDCVTGVESGALALTDSTISGIAVTYPADSYGESIYALGTVTLSDDTVFDCPNDGQIGNGGVYVAPGMASTAPTDTLTISGLMMSHCGSLQVEPGLQGAIFTAPQVHDVTVTDSRDEAVSIDANDVTFGPGADIDDLTGSENYEDWADLDVTVSGDLNWVTPTNSAVTHPLGYFGSINMLGGTLTVPADGVVEPADITLTGGSLVATAGGATFEAYARQGSDFIWTAGSLTVLDGPLGQPPTVDLEGVTWTNLDTISDPATVTGASVTITNSSLTSAEDDPPGGHITDPNLVINSGTLAVSGSSLTGIDLTASGAGNYSIRDTTIDGSVEFGGAQTALTSDAGATVHLDTTDITGASQGLSSFGATITGSCDALNQLPSDIYVDQTGQVTMTDSDVLLNQGSDASQSVQTSGGQVDLERDAWDWTTPPSGGNIDSADPVVSFDPSATMSFSGAAFRADGTVGTGDLTIQLSFNREMNTDPEDVPQVVFATAAGSRTLTGSWTDDQTYVSSTVITTADSGPAGITSYGARGCANDPSYNSADYADASIYIGAPKKPVIGTHPKINSSTPPTATFTFETVGATSHVCRLDGVSHACKSPYSLFNLKTGTHHLEIFGVNDAGVGPAAAFTWRVDQEAPQIVYVSSSPALSLTPRATYAVAAVEAGPVRRREVEVRYRAAAPGHALGKYMVPKSWTHRVGSARVSIKTIPGHTYCFSARAGNQARWSGETCTTRAEDDRAFNVTNSNWYQVTGKAYYDGTLSVYGDVPMPINEVSTEQLGDRVSIRSWTCANCGNVRVYFGTKRLGVIDLQRAGPSRPMTTTFRLRVVQQGLVRLVGIGLSPVNLDAFGVADLSTD